MTEFTTRLTHYMQTYYCSPELSAASWHASACSLPTQDSTIDSNEKQTQTSCYARIMGRQQQRATQRDHKVNVETA